MKPIDVKRSTVTLDPDPTHVLARPFRLMSHSRSVKIAARVMALSESEVHTQPRCGANASPMWTSATATCPMSFTRAAALCTTGRSSFPTGYPTTPPRSLRCRSSRSWPRWISGRRQDLHFRWQNLHSLRRTRCSAGASRVVAVEVRRWCQSCTGKAVATGM